MKHKQTIGGLLLLALFLAVNQNALANTTRYVNGLHGSDSNNCSSQQTACKTIGHAISLSASGDAIMVAAATYKENLTIPFNLTISGAAQATIVDGRKAGAVVTIRNTSAHVSLSGLTIQNGSGSNLGGGGIYNAGVLTITNTTVSGNQSFDIPYPGGGLGGGINNAGTLTLIQSTVSGNTTSRFRTGASAAGGGIYNSGNLTLTNSTINGNTVLDFWPANWTYGGGIANENGTLQMNNSTISQNVTTYLTPFGTAYGFGSGLYNSGPRTAVVLQNSIFGSDPGGNCNGALSSEGYNISGDNTCPLHGPGDMNNRDPKLGPLQNNGGPTQTMALLPGSPAILAGNPSGCTDGRGNRLEIDQRMHARPDLGACDMGAYEVKGE